MHSVRKLSFFIEIPRDKLDYLSVDITKHYKPFPKRTGTKERMIDNPIGLLKEVQKRVNDRMLAKIGLPSYVIGGIPGRKPSDHPGLHVNKRVVATIDVKDFFPSVTNHQVYRIWSEKMGCSHDVAHLLTKLTTHQGHLPLGAPTSTMLANLALADCMARVYEFAEKAGLVMSQYIDDIAFSGPELPKDFLNTVI